jgi:BCCT family betaine/carnitine transporter
MFIKISAEWNKTIISLAIVLSLLLSIYVLSDPVGSSKLLFKLYDSLTVIFEPTYMYGSFSVLIFLIFIALSKYGDIKISLQNKETHSFFSWGSMLFAAGIGAALLYWATIEWIDYFNILRSQSLDIDTALLYSRTYPIFHWSFTAWAIYCLPAIAFGLAITINQKSKLTFSGIFNIKNKFLEILFDSLFIGAILCGAGVGLGLSFPLISSILSNVFNIEKTFNLDIFTIAVCLSIFATSAYLGIQKGIKRLSNFNIILVLLFLVLIFILGPTQYIFSKSIESYLFLFKQYPEFSFATGTEISKDWSVFYWAWWMALAPMVGAFIVNISNGKSLRSIILGVIFIGSVGCMISMSVLSNLSIYLFESGFLNSPMLLEDGMLNREQIIIKTLSTLSFSNYLLIGFGIICIIFLCTTYDSTSYILASASMKSSNIESSGNLRLIFAILLVIQPTLLMFLGGVDSFKWIMVIFSVPLLFVYLLLMISIVKNIIAIKKA